MNFRVRFVRWPNHDCEIACYFHVLISLIVTGMVVTNQEDWPHLHSRSVVRPFIPFHINLLGASSGPAALSVCTLRALFLLGFESLHEVEGDPRK